MAAQYATADRSPADDAATAGVDYTAASGALTIPAGSTSATITVASAGHTLYRPDKKFNVVLSQVVGAAAGSWLGVGTIRGEDPMPSLSVADARGKGTVIFPVHLSAACAVNVRVDYTTVAGDADLSVHSGTLVIPAGQTVGSVWISVGANPLKNATTFGLQLSNAVNASLTDTQATGTVLPDSQPMPTGGCGKTGSPASYVSLYALCWAGLAAAKGMRRTRDRR